MSSRDDIAKSGFLASLEEIAKKRLEAAEKADGLSGEAPPFKKGEGFKRVQAGELSAKKLAFGRGADIACGCALPLNSHNHTFFSVMDGIASPEDMVDTTAMRGFGGIGISDHGTMGGVLRAGKAGKSWKTARLKGSSKLFNYREVKFDKQLKKYQLCDANWNELTNTKSLLYIASGLPKAYVTHNSANSKLFRIVDRQEREGGGIDLTLVSEVDLKKHLERFELADPQWQVVPKGDIELVLKFFPDCLVTHNVDDVKKYRIVQKDDFEAFDAFKVVSGCELYVSWEKEKEKKYHHITVYATGEKGHRALVLLTSIGSIPSRRYIGARGFFRPRVFVEDIEVAVKEAEGELVVTTGCPISITSDALRAGNEQGARDFFEWGVRTLPKGRFFAELHLCDVSLDFNSKYAKAEDRFYSSLYGIPISRFRHEDLKSAQDHAGLFHERLRLYVLGLSLASYKISHDGSVADAQQESDFYINPDNPETLEFAKKHRTTGRTYPLEDAGIFDDAYKLFSGEMLGVLKDMTYEVSREVDGLIDAGMDGDADSDGADSDDTADTSDGKEETASSDAAPVDPLAEPGSVAVETHLTEAASAGGASCGDDQRSDDEGEGGETASKTKTKGKGKGKGKKNKDQASGDASLPNSAASPVSPSPASAAGGVVGLSSLRELNLDGSEPVVPVAHVQTEKPAAIGALSTTKVEGAKKKKKKKQARLDEDTLTLLNLAKTVVQRAESRSFDNKDKAVMLAAATLARFALYVIAMIGRDENLAFVNPLPIIQTMLSTASSASLAKKEDADSLLAISEDRGLCLDLVLAGQMDKDILFGAVRALVEMLKPETIGEAKLAPTAGDEDGLEKEWFTHPSGNWMEKVNAGLSKLSKEYDVPLMMASDAHMTVPAMKQVQDAIMKRGKRRNWHMARPYAIPRGTIMGFMEDAGADWTLDKDYITHEGNCAFRMIEKGCISLEDIVESFGSGSLLLEEVKPAGEFKWKTAVPKIRYSNHPNYQEAKELLESGGLREFLPIQKKDEGDFVFSEASINISTSLIVISFMKAVEEGLFPGTDEYVNRLYSELFLQQEVPHEQLCDFFLVLGYVIEKFREKGVSVGPGRGSSGGMLTAMFNGITYGDPIKKNFLESRWMNRGRKEKGSHADIDVDVSDRQIAGLELAKVAKESFEDAIKERPLTPLEVILHAELFFSSAPVTHEWVGGVVREVAVKKKDLVAGLAENLGMARAARSFADLGPRKEKDPDAPAGKFDNKEGGDDPDADSADLIKIDDNGGNIVWVAPIFRVGTYGSLKAKAAVKEAIRMRDQTAFDDLPSFGAPTTAWLQENSERISGKTDEQKNRIFEEEKFGHLPLKERMARRRVKLGDQLTKEMTMGAGLARLYQSERDFFMGSVYAVVPSYWDAAARPPTGSELAKKYFDANEDVKELILDMLYIYKSMGVHAGGLCFGREAIERVPLRADKHGYVAQLEMKDIETVGVLKFDILGLETLNHVSMTLRMMVEEMSYDKPDPILTTAIIDGQEKTVTVEPTHSDYLSWWCPKNVYEQVKAGRSTDVMWRHFPMSAKESIDAMCQNRAMTFQIDTKVFGKELDKLDPKRIYPLISAYGPFDDVKNDRLVDIIGDLLALFRPGPMKFNSNVEYIDRLMGKPYTVLHPWLEPFVKQTFGLIAYQEQVMAIYRAGAIVLDDSGKPKLLHGKFIQASLEDTDEVRRALTKKDIGALDKMKALPKFLAGMGAQGVDEQSAQAIWDLIVPFAEYGFNCFAGDQLIVTEDGLVPLADIGSSYKGKVASMAEDGSLHYEVPSFSGAMGEKEVLEVTLADGTVIRATADHFFRFEGMWVPLSALLDIGMVDSAVTISGNKKNEFFGRIKIVAVKSLGLKTVYDITLPTHHNFVLENGVVASNCPHSWHYSIISCLTLGLKSIYTRYFFRVVMGLSKPEDAARFLGEISHKTRTPCILRSKEVFWEVIDDQYFPGLFTIDGLKRKDIERILAVQTALKKELGPKEQPTAEMWFKHMGLLTESLSLTLAKSGALRILGTPDEIADGYAKAIVTYIKPSLAKKKADKKAGVVDDPALVAASSQPSASDSASDMPTLDNAFDDLIFDLREASPLDKRPDDEDEDDAPARETSSSKGGRKKETKAKEYKLGKKDEAVVHILRSKGMAFAAAADTSSGQAAGILTVQSAMDMVLSNKTRGAGLRHLAAALVKAETDQARAQNRRARVILMVKELKALRRDDGSQLASDQQYRTVAIPKAVSNSKNYRTGESEYRITFLSEGSEINAKFSRNMTNEQIEQITQTLKDEKMQTPFIVDVYVGQFQNESRELITYFKIENVEKVT